MTDFAPPAARAETALRKHFPGTDISLTQLAGDASTRQYFRCRLSPQESVIAAVYEQPFVIEDFSYEQVYRLFQTIGLPTAKTLASEAGLGIILQEDLGDDSLQARLQTSNVTERQTWLLQAIDYLVTLQQDGVAALKPGYQASGSALDGEKLLWELHFFMKHYLGSFRRVELRNPDQLEEEFSRISDELNTLPRVLCHRDYQVRNLLIKRQSLYVIDFQDAQWGPFCYDLTSLLKDSIDLNQESIDRCTSYYLDQRSSPKPSGFNRHFHLMCIQRLLKALGTYGNQITNLGRDTYRRYVHGSLERVILSLEAVPEFPYIQDIVEKELTQTEDRN